MIAPEYVVNVVKSFGLHIFFGVVVVLSFNFPGLEKKPEETPEVSAIDAVVIDQASLEKQVKKINDEKARIKAAEEKRVKDLEKRAADAKKQLSSLNKQKEQSKKDAEAAKKKAKKEKEKAEKARKERIKREQEAAKAKKLEKEAKRKREEEEKAAKAAKKKREEEQAALKKAEAERKRKAEEERKRKEQERLEKERKEKEAKEKALQEKMLQEQLAREQAVRQQARRKAVLTEVQKYSALIKDKIQRNLLIDQQAMKGKRCLINVKLSFSGLVLSAERVSGDALLCKAAENAALKAQNVPMSKDADVYRELKDFEVEFDL